MGGCFSARNTQTFIDEVWLSVIMDAESFPAFSCSLEITKMIFDEESSSNELERTIERTQTNETNQPMYQTDFLPYFMDMLKVSTLPFVHSTFMMKIVVANRNAHNVNAEWRNVLRNTKLISKWIEFSYHLLANC